MTRRGDARPAGAGSGHAIVVFGRGYAVDALGGLPWLADRDVVYWGDLDTHGFAILDRFRSTFPRVRSMLMDRETLLAHRAMWVVEKERHPGGLTRLTDGEARVFAELASDVHGPAVRLEQERIRFGWVKGALARLL